MPISPNNKYRCQTAAEQYRHKKAPFIVVSGGHVHPFQTPYCEAVEMKKYLITELKIPEQAVILEPYARHTITNFRNVNRILFYTNMPLNKQVLCVTSKYHTDYINMPLFEQRCVSEIGYVPFNNMKRISDFISEFSPNVASLQTNSLDPLDP